MLLCEPVYSNHLVNHKISFNCFTYMWQETLRQKERKGDLTISGTTDVLTLALGTPEHAGRVRGVGGFVQPNQYFHLPKRRKESVHETVRLSVKQILEEEREKMETEIREKVLAEEKEKIAADERAHWVSRLEQLEAKINGLGNTEPVVIEHVSGEASCSKTHEPCMGAEQGLKAAKKQNNHVEAGAMTKVFEEMEKKLVQKQRKKTSKGMKDKIAKPTTLGVDDEAKVLDKELYVDAVKNDAEEIESVDLNLIEKQNKVFYVHYVITYSLIHIYIYIICYWSEKDIAIIIFLCIFINIVAAKWRGAY